MAPHKHRGALNIGFQLSITVGILGKLLIHLFSVKIKGDMEWRLSLGGAIFPSLITIIGSLFLPDTPTSLMECGRVPDAKRELERVQYPHDVDEEFSRLVPATEASKRVRQPWRDLMLQRKFRPHIIMAVLIPVFQQLMGISAMLFSLLLNMIGYKEDATLISDVITVFTNIAATLVSIYGVDLWGRRSLLLKGGAQMLICQVTLMNTKYLSSSSSMVRTKGILHLFQVIITIAIGLVELHSVAKLHLMLIKSYAIIVVIFICIYLAGLPGRGALWAGSCQVRFFPWKFVQSLKASMSRST